MFRRGTARVQWAPTMLITYLAAGFVSFGVISPPEHCPAVTVADLRGGAEAAAGWLVTNQRPDGSYLYQYERDGDVVVDAYNVVRHSGVVMSLYMAAGYGIEGAFESADRGLVWSLERLATIDDQAAAGDGPDKPSVGATALLVAGLAQRRDQTGDARYDDLLERMGRFLVGQVEPSGAVSARYDIATRAPVAGAYSIYYTGEVYWALVHLQRLFPDGPWSEAVERVAAYVAGPRDEAEDMGHVRDHWAAYGMSETNASGDAAHDRRLTANQIEYARHQAEISGTTVRWLSQEAGPWGLVVRGRSELRGGGYGTIGEALTRLWRSARAEPDLADLRDSLGSRVLCLAAMTLDHQADNDDAAGAPHPARITGAWFKGGETRMDDQQHALSALLQSIDIVEGTTPAAPTRGDHERPTRWLWLVALVCALNPARTAGAVRRRDAGGRASRAVGWGVGGAVVAVLGAAFVAGPLLDGLDVSNPAFRVSAGALGALAGIVGLVRRRPAADQGTEPSSVAAGLRIAATIASASVLGLTIGAAADRGVALVVVALVISAALTLAAAAPRPGAVTSTVLQLAERATAAVLMVASVLLIVAGVMAV